MNKKLLFLLSILLLLLFLYKIDKVKTINDISKMNRIEIYDCDNNLIYSSNNLHEGSYVTINEIPDKIKKIFILSEDKNFYNHSGFDIYRITSSFLTRSKSGASTITQQYIKNLYFNNERNYERKIKELYLSIRLERIYTKDEILEGYLNTLYFNYNIFGIKDAAYYYFNKELIELSISEICVLANIIKNPTDFSPIDNLSIAYQKRNNLIKNLYSLKAISKSEMTRAIKSEILITSTRHKLYDDTILYFKDIVLKELKALNISKDFNQTINVYTKYNTKLNNSINSKIKNSNLKSNISSLIVDKDGYIISNIGGINYYTSSFNIALDGTRQIASTVKPILYYYALTKGYSSDFKIDSRKSIFTINGLSYSFSNFANLYEDKPITMGYALATSDNMYSLKLHVLLGLKGITSMLGKYGIYSEPNIQQAIGNVSISLSKLLEIYYSFMTLGKKTTFKAIDKVYINKKIYYKEYFKYKTILDEKLCKDLINMMTNMFDSKLSHITSVTGKSISPYLNSKCAGKSGLSDYDSYMIGFNQNYLIGVWVGKTDNTMLIEPFDKAFPKQLFLEAFNTLVNKNENFY